MKRVIPIFIFFLLGFVSAFGQKQSQGIPYQAVARDASGTVLANMPLQVTLALTDRAEGSIDYYSERHEVQTDENGLFQLVIGKGISRNGYLNDVPWMNNEVWVEITINGSGQSDLAIKQAVKLFSVPYALFAETAKKLTDAKEVEPRNQSIYWTSTGNVNTRPPHHFLGNHDAKDLVVKTSGETRATFTSNGQLQIKAGSTVRGSDKNITSYPVYIKGANQGVHIKVTGSRDANNNFVSFVDPEGIQGRIEGQTYLELISDPFYIIQAAVYTIDGISIVAGGVAAVAKAAGFGAAVVTAAISLFFAWQVPGWALSAIGEGVKVGAAIIEGAALLTNSISWAVDMAVNVGVAFSSGGADYAEYLPRASYASDLSYGDIVGVRGGTISRITESVDHLMVVSQNPGFLGNVPAEDNIDNYEKVAFLGQVMVKVAGAVSSGDYILPSGNNDGVGIAVRPEDMLMEDYGRIVGVAWESAEEAPLNLVNCSIGLTQNEIAPQVEEISNKVDNIIAHLKGEGPLRPEVTTSANAQNYGPFGRSTPQPQQTLPKIFSNQEFDEIVDHNQEVLREMYGKAETALRASGQVDVSASPGMMVFYADPIGQLKQMRRNPKYDNLWGMMDYYFMQKLDIPSKD